MWLLKLALAILACPQAFLPLARRTLAAMQLRRTIIELPHGHRELHVAFELGAGSATLAVAIMAHSYAFFQCPLLGIKIMPSPCFLAGAAALRHTILASADRICVHPLFFKHFVLPFCFGQALHILEATHSPQIRRPFSRAHRDAGKSFSGSIAPHRKHARLPFAKHLEH